MKDSSLNPSEFDAHAMGNAAATVSTSLAMIQARLARTLNCLAMNTSGSSKSS